MRDGGGREGEGGGRGKGEGGVAKFSFDRDEDTTFSEGRIHGDGNVASSETGLCDFGKLTYASVFMFCFIDRK
jgi:hypothetical protein